MLAVLLSAFGQRQFQCVIRSVIDTKRSFGECVSKQSLGTRLSVEAGGEDSGHQLLELAKQTSLFGVYD
jgi:hypothetical protein